MESGRRGIGAAGPRHDLLRHQRRLGERRRPRRPRRRRRATASSSRTAAGAGSHTWRAYLSTQAAGGQPAVNARDRIGQGPWQNAKGEVVAQSVAQLHDGNNLTKATALDEKGQPVKGRGDQPNQHDILTGSQPDGTPSRAPTT